jgi:hypothetical protein
MEVETGTAVRRWLPVHVWTYKGDGFAAVQWWFITSACVAVPAVWSWRRGRRDAGRGFEVNPARSVDAA